MLKILKIYIAIILSVLAFAACNQQKLPLPVPNVESTTFGASDTNYVELSPIWDSQNLGYRFSDPRDITIGPDGIIFVADKGNDRIVALSKAGQVMTTDGLGSIQGISGPIGVDVDSKLNLLVTNGTNKLYCWNQFINHIDIDSVANQAVFFDSAENDTILLTLEQYIAKAMAGKTLPTFRYFIYTRNAELISSTTAVYTLYEAPEPDASINGVAAGKYGSEQVFITESNYDRLSMLLLVPSLAIKSTEGSILFKYVGIKVSDIATYGSGAGTVDNPFGITVDESGNLYFTQLAGNFRVQKLVENYLPGYVLYQHDIMDLDRFVSPADVALDDQNNLFIIDSDLGTVSKFDNAGTGAGNLMSLGSKGLAATTFNNAQGIMVQDNVVYVVESGENRIRRFQYSVSESDIPDDEKKP